MKNKMAIIITIFFSLSSSAGFYPCSSLKKIIKKYKNYRATSFENGEFYDEETVKLLPIKGKKNYYSYHYLVDEQGDEYDSDYDLHFISGYWANKKYLARGDKKFPKLSCVVVTHDSGHTGRDFEELERAKVMSKSSFRVFYQGNSFIENNGNDTFVEFSALK